MARQDKGDIGIKWGGGGGARFLVLRLCCHSLLNGANRSLKIQAFFGFQSCAQ
ncbi:hypothetical protein hp2017_1314 [Helicobacter pylori 2017]|nr:hypothetical protein hp2017_1314 [Helicobacter pylori 2017]